MAAKWRSTCNCVRLSAPSSPSNSSWISRRSCSASSSWTATYRLRTVGLRSPATSSTCVVTPVPKSQLVTLSCSGRFGSRLSRNARILPWACSHLRMTHSRFAKSRTTCLGSRSGDQWDRQGCSPRAGCRPGERCRVPAQPIEPHWPAKSTHLRSTPSNRNLPGFGGQLVTSQDDDHVDVGRRRQGSVIRQPGD